MMFIAGWLVGLIAFSLLVWSKGVSLWWLFLLIPLYTVMFFFLLYAFSDRREYRKVNGRVQVKEGRGDWEDLKEHMKREHPEE